METRVKLNVWFSRERLAYGDLRIRRALSPCTLYSEVIPKVRYSSGSWERFFVEAGGVAGVIVVYEMGAPFHLLQPHPGYHGPGYSEGSLFQRSVIRKVR